MKRAIGILGVAALAAAFTYLLITRNMAIERAKRLDADWMAAESRILVLEEQLDAARRLARQLEQAAMNRPRLAARPEGPAAAGQQVAAAGPAEPAPIPAARAGHSPGFPFPVLAPGESLRYAAARAGGVTNLVRIEGTSSLHDWQVESRLVGGMAELGPSFFSGIPAGTNGTPVDAQVSVFIPVRSLKSVQADGSPYSDAMDDIMYSSLKLSEYPRITYNLISLAPVRQAPETRPADPKQMLFDATGELTVGGVAKAVTMRVTVTAVSGDRLQFSGTLPVKMTDFKINPPKPKGMPITTGDDITLRFVWGVSPAGSVASGR